MEARRGFHGATLLAAVAFQLAAGRCACAAPAVDLRPGLEVGSYGVSRYLVEKYYHRYADGFQVGQHRPISPAEARAWLELFVAQQVVIAREEAAGYAARPEVVSAVGRMERYMLTQPQGPFYDALDDREPAPDETELRAQYDRAAVTVEATVARFADPADAERWLGGDFDTVSAGEQTGRILRIGDRDGVVIEDGVFSWPFLPFSEIGGVIESAPSGRWIRHFEPGFGEYLVLARRKWHRANDDWRTVESAFRLWSAQMRRDALREQRQARMLRSAAFSIDPAAAQLLVDRCRRFMTGHFELPENVSRGIGDRVLFRYQIGEVAEAVTIEGFRRHAEGQFMRTSIGAISDLRRQCEDMAQEELDYRAAKELGIDRTAQFTEDRKGFTGLQVLDLYEREALAPHITIPSRQVELYFDEHRSDFREPELNEAVASRIHAILLRPALDARELALAADWSRNLNVRVARFDFADAAPGYALLLRP